MRAMGDGVMRTENERYVLEDWEMDGITVSKTTLKPKQSTRGHSHPNPEIYVFLDVCELDHGKWGESVKKGEMRKIPPNEFHRVSNPFDTPVEFISVFVGKRKKPK